MAGKPLALTMERIIWQSRVWIDGKLLPSAEESLTTPHVHSIPSLPEGEHEIMVRIDNRKRYNLTNREMAHSYTEETQIKWNGILGRIELSAVPAVKIDDIRVYPDIEDRSIRVLTTLVRTEKVDEGTLALNVKGFGKKELPVILDKNTVKVDAVYPMGKKAELWDEFSPVVYTLDASFGDASYTTDFGPRSVAGKPVEWTLTSDGQKLASGTGDIVVTRDSLEAYTALSEGRKVLYSPEPSSLQGAPGKFLPTFWSPVFFPAEAGTMGILCDPSNPALAEFPTDSHSNWQWWWLARHSTAVEYDDTVTPIVEVIDNFALNRHLSYVYEKKEGEGRMVFSAIDLLSGAARERPEAQQLLYSLVEYLKTD